MRFMALENFFYGGELHEATPATPKIFDFPDDEIPNLRWRPLDLKAKKALESHAAKVKEETGNIHRTFDIPKEFGAMEVGELTTIEKPEPVDPDLLPDVTIAAIAPRQKVEKIAKSGRASDQEPK
jgi:hypothetical protein